MFPTSARPAALILALGFVLVAPIASGAESIDSILRPPAGPAAPPTGLGPTRLQGDFAAHLDALLAAGDPVPATATAAIPAATVPGAATTTGADSVAVATAGPAVANERQPSVVLPIAGGIVGGTIGFYGGVVAGLAVSGDDEWDDLAGAIIGACAGEILVLPLGVHLGNARTGSYAADLGMSFVTGLAGIGVFSLLGYDLPGFVLGAGLQLGAVVWTERRKASQRLAERAGTP